MEILDGRKVADSILTDIKRQLQGFSSSPTLAIILVGDDPSSRQYVDMKQKKAKIVGISTKLFHYPADVSADELKSLIRQLNLDPAVNGILIQLPLPQPLPSDEIVAIIDSQKDVDGLTPVNLGLLYHRHSGALISATPLGILKLLQHYRIPLSGKNAVIINRSPYIGLPLAALLLAQDCTVTVCHSQTVNLLEICRQSDVLVSAIGKGRFIKSDYIKEGAVVVDVGLSFDNHSGKLIGDVDFDQAASKASYVTPVPGGIGPMTIACLLANTLQSFEKRF